MTKRTVYELIEANGLNLHGDIEHFAELVRAEVLAEQEPVAYLCENAVGHKYFRWKKPSSIYKPIALYTRGQA